MVAGGDAQTGMAIDDTGLLGRDGYVGQQSGNQSRTHRRAMDRADDRLIAVNDVVDQVARLLPDLRAGDEIIRNRLHHRQIATARKAQPITAQHGATHRIIRTQVAPNFA